MCSSFPPSLLFVRVCEDMMKGESHALFHINILFNFLFHPIFTNLIVMFLCFLVTGNFLCFPCVCNGDDGDIIESFITLKQINKQEGNLLIRFASY